MEEQHADRVGVEDWEELWDSFWRVDRLDALWWAAGFIWAGLVLLVETAGLVESVAWWNGWSVFFSGAGVLTLAVSLLRMVLPAYRRKVIAGQVFGLILLAIGLSGFWAVIWPLALISVGLVIIGGAFARRR